MKNLKLSNFEKFINIIIDEKSKVIENNFSPSWFVLYQIINDLFDLLIQHIKSIITLYKNDKFSFCSACVIARTIIETYSYIVFILQPEENSHKIIRLYHYIAKANEKEELRGFKKDIKKPLTTNEINEKNNYLEELYKQIDDCLSSNQKLYLSSENLKEFKKEVKELSETVKTNGDWLNIGIIVKAELLKKIIIEDYSNIEEDSKEYINNMKHNLNMKNQDKTVIPNMQKMITTYIIADFDLYLLAIVKLLNDKYFRLLNFYFHYLIEQYQNNLWVLYMSFSKFIHSGFTSTISIENEYKDSYWRELLLISYYTLDKVSEYFFNNFNENWKLENIIDESLIEELKKEFKLLSDRQRA